MPHPKVREAYDQAGYEYIEKADDMARQKFYQLVTWGADSMTPVHQLEHSITKITRVRVGIASEFVYYDEKVEGYDMLENMHNYTELHGKYSMPVFRKEYDQQLRRAVGREVVSHETRYDIPYSKEKVRDLMSKSKEGQIFLYVESAGRRYGSFSQEDFIEATFDELVSMGKNAKTLFEVRHPAPVIIQQQQSGQQDQQQQSLSQHKRQEQK